MTFGQLLKSGKVQAGELAVQYQRFFVVGSCCFFGRSKRADVRDFSVGANNCNPFAPTLTWEHTFVSATRVPLRAAIHAVLAGCRDADIPSTVVQSVAVFVVGIKVLRHVKNVAVHFDTAGTVCVPMASIPHGLPISLPDATSVDLVDDRELAPRQWDEHRVGVGGVGEQFTWSTSTHRGAESAQSLQSDSRRWANKRATAAFTSKRLSANPRLSRASVATKPRVQRTVAGKCHAALFAGSSYASAVDHIRRHFREHPMFSVIRRSSFVQGIVPALIIPERGYYA